MRALLGWLFLAAVFSASVHSEDLACTDFLSFNFQGNAKVPLDAFDYNSSVLSLRVSSGREQSFHFPNVSHKYFYVSLEDYAFRGSKSGDVYFQNTAGNDPRNYYFSVLNASSVPWYCGNQKMADLSVSTETLSGRFYTSEGVLLALSKLKAVGLETSFEDGFLVTDYATAKKIYVVADPSQDELAKGYLLYDAGNRQFFASAFRTLRFRVPAEPATFCRDFSGYCLDAAGAHANSCANVRTLEQFFCNLGACISNVTACSGSCQDAACVAATPTPVTTASPAASSGEPFEPTLVAPTVSVSASLSTPSPSASTGDTGFVVPVLVVLAVAGLGYYFLFMVRRPRGL